MLNYFVKCIYLWPQKLSILLGMAVTIQNFTIERDVITFCLNVYAYWNESDYFHSKLKSIWMDTRLLLNHGRMIMCSNDLNEERWVNSCRAHLAQIDMLILQFIGYFLNCIVTMKLSLWTVFSRIMIWKSPGEIQAN